MINKIFLLILTIVLLIPLNNIYAAINIPITISEAIPDNVPCISRINEPVTVGIPLAKSANITTVNQLGISGESVGQFRVLKRYPNNNIEWVLVDTQTSVSANNSTTLSLIDGFKKFGGVSLASDAGNEILVNTKEAVFTINKTNFNILDVVDINGTRLVNSGNTGQIFIEVEGVVYSSVNSTSSVSIEENGPVRSVIKVTGRLESSGGATLGGYIIRMHFYKGKSYVRCDTEISNAYQDTTGAIYIDEATLRVPLAITNNLNYEFGYNNTSIQGNISNSAWIYQGNYGQYGDRAPDTGLEIANNNSIIHSLGNLTDHSQGWGIIDNGNTGLAVGIGQLKINEPAGMEFFENGMVDISLVSSHKSSAITLQGGQHILNIMYLNFFDSRPSATETEHLTQYPLVARTTLNQYNSAGGIYGIPLVSVEDERNFFISNNKTFPEGNIENSLREHVNRNYGWATSGTPNSDWNLRYLMDFLRTGNGALYLSAFQGGIHNSTVATDRSDDFNYFENVVDYHQSSSLWGHSYDEAHTYWEGLPYIYLNTGNEFIKDAIVDFGEWNNEYITHTGYRSFYVLSYSRNWSRSYRNMTILAWILDDDHYISTVDTMTNLLFITVDTDNNHANGVNYERGYINPAHSVGSDFMSSKLFPQALQISSFCMGEDWESFERIQDLISGWGYFVFGEFYVYNNDTCREFGYQYKYNIDEPSATSLRSKQSEVVLSHLYKQTGDRASLDRAAKLIFGEIDCGWSDSVASEVGAHALVSASDLQVDVDYVSQVGSGRVDIETSHITNNGGGNYTITWIEPQDDISRYQIKFSSQPIVNNLNFSQITRIYQYDPDVYDNFWSSLNINNEPSPSMSGVSQFVSINIPQVINDYNNRYNLTVSDLGYVSYTSGPYYFAIKYFSQSEIIKNVRFDVNQDSQINTIDAMLILRASLGLDMIETDWEALDAIGDVNCNNNLNLIDAMLLLRYSLGLDMSDTNWCE